MADPNSLCRVDWRLGQALMPEHFLLQEDSLLRAWEERFAHGPLPLWGVVALEWDEDLLRSGGRLLIKRLQLVLETGLLVDIPGNARPLALDLPKPQGGPVEVFLQAESAPEFAKGEHKLPDGNLIELRVQRLSLSHQEAKVKTPQPGFKLGRFKPLVEDDGEGVGKASGGWEWDFSYVPPLVHVSAIRPFADSCFSAFQVALSRWKLQLTRHATENVLDVHKRVEALLALRRAQSLEWRLRQVAQRFAPDEGKPEGAESGALPSLRAHPFDFYSWMVELYLDIHAFWLEPRDLLERDSTLDALYRHEQLAECYSELQVAIGDELRRPPGRTREWKFRKDPNDASRWVCELPDTLQADAEVYLLVQFAGRRRPGSAEDEDLDRRLLGMKLAAPERLAIVECNVLTGIPYSRVRLVPFPHNFDASRVHFYRLERGEEWAFAVHARRVVFRLEHRGIERCFLYSPDAST